MQTRQPTHATIVAVATGRFKAFARYELDRRKALRYPPWGRLLRLIVSDPDAGEVERISRELRSLIQLRIKQFGGEGSDTAVQLLGPAPAPLERLRDRYRYHILVKSDSKKMLSRLAKEIYLWRSTIRNAEDPRVAVDIDPMEML